MTEVPGATRRWNIGSRCWLAGIVAVALALGTGCADVWGFADLKEGAADAGLDARVPDTGVPDTGAPVSDDGGGVPLCSNPPGTILSCGGCNQACDTNQSLVTRCDGDSLCVYHGCAAGWLDCDQSPPNINGCESSTTSPTSCGVCDAICDTTHSLGATCVALAGGGVTCEYTGGCKPGWGDCNKTAPDTDGCETQLTAIDNCGGCGNTCDTKNSQGAACDGKTCSYSGCNPGFGDCMATAPDTDGCETAVPTNSCMACGTSCDTVHSNGATCDTTATPVCKYPGLCKTGFADCNMTPPDTNGCETDITTATNCGACGRSCDTMTSLGAGCSASNCTYTGCMTGFDDCDKTAPDTNGCESSLSSTTSCGQCGVACSPKTGPASCNGATCSYKCNAGLIDCNGGTPPDVDGCECQTSSSAPGCCSGKCQTVHSNGVGQSFYDCSDHTITPMLAKEACEAFAGPNQCASSSTCCLLGALGACVGSMATSMCGSVGGKCLCWQYAGNAPGTVQSVGNGKCTAACGSTSDTSWN
jgi:hypothetical protein